jgi:hypothetical protein
MLPNLIVIGAARSGTTSLHLYLREHPQIFMAQGKELNFFLLEKNWQRGLEWYEHQFPAGSALVYGESSVRYSAYPEYAGVPERLAAVVPEAKLVYLVRDPVDRLASQYAYLWREGVELRPARKAVLAASPNRYLDRSRYAMQLERYRVYYPDVRILVVDQDDLRHRRQPTLARVFRFLGVDESFTSPAFETVHNARAVGAPSVAESRTLRVGAHVAKPVARVVMRGTPRRIRARLAPPLADPLLDAATTERLVEVLRPDTERLRALTGLTFPSWKT